MLTNNSQKALQQIQTFNIITIDASIDNPRIVLKTHLSIYKVIFLLNHFPKNTKLTKESLTKALKVKYKRI